MKKATATATATARITRLARALLKTRAARRALEAREDKVKKEILHLVPKIPFSVSLSEETEFRIQLVEYSAFDLERFKAEYPKLYERYRLDKTRIDMREVKAE